MTGKTVVTLTQQEIDDTQQLIADGKLPANWFETYRADVEKNVFGHDVKYDRRGNPIEQGIGSAVQPSRNSIEAYKKWCSHEPGFAENVKKMETALAAYEAKQTEERDRRRAAR